MCGSGSRSASAAGRPIGSWRGEVPDAAAGVGAQSGVGARSAVGTGARTAIWVRTGAAVWCQAETDADGGQTKRSSGAGVASGLRRRRHFPVRSGLWVPARLFRKELRGRCGQGAGLSAGTPARRPVVLSSCRLVALSPCRPAVPPSRRPAVPSDRFLRSASPVRVVQTGDSAAASGRGCLGRLQSGRLRLFAGRGLAQHFSQHRSGVSLSGGRTSGHGSFGRLQSGGLRLFEIGRAHV